MVYENQCGCCKEKELLGTDQIAADLHHRYKRQGLGSGIVEGWEQG